MVAVRYRLVRNLMFAAGVLYCSLLLEALSGYPLDVRNSFLSELGALDQPTSRYARAMDLATGVLLLVAALLSRSAVRLHRDTAGLWISTAVFGAATLFDSLSPMDCAPSASVACQAAEANGQAGVALALHEVTSTLAGLGTIAMSVCAVLVLRRAGWGGRCSKAAAALAAGVAVTNVWLGIETGLDVLTGNELEAPGILQRISVLLVCLMLATVLPALRQALSR
ncbi:MAG TPA: DUF998 domain-containing protein [Kribbella sp.]|jgi:hypothetical protein